MQKRQTEKDNELLQKAEINFQTSKSEYISARDEAGYVRDRSKSTYHVARIEQCDTDQKRLYSVLNEHLKKKHSAFLPYHSSKVELVETFNTFFIDKIKWIRDDRETQKQFFCYTEPPVNVCLRECLSQRISENTHFSLEVLGF